MDCQLKLKLNHAERTPILKIGQIGRHAQKLVEGEQLQEVEKVLVELLMKLKYV